MIRSLELACRAPERGPDALRSRLAADDAAAKATAKTLAESLGFETIDAGGLKNARYLEPLAGLNIYLRRFAAG